MTDRTRPTIAKQTASFKEAETYCHSNGFTLRKTDEGKFRLNFRGGPEATAYYTDELQDAVDTVLGYLLGNWWVGSPEGQDPQADSLQLIDKEEK